MLVVGASAVQAGKGAATRGAGSDILTAKIISQPLILARERPAREILSWTSGANSQRTRGMRDKKERAGSQGLFVWV